MMCLPASLGILSLISGAAYWMNTFVVTQYAVSGYLKILSDNRIVLADSKYVVLLESVGTITAFKELSVNHQCVINDDSTDTVGITSLSGAAGTTAYAELDNTDLSTISYKYDSVNSGLDHKAYDSSGNSYTTGKATVSTYKAVVIEKKDSGGSVVWTNYYTLSNNDFDVTTDIECFYVYQSGKVLLVCRARRVSTGQNGSLILGVNNDGTVAFAKLNTGSAPRRYRVKPTTTDGEFKYRVKETSSQQGYIRHCDFSGALSIPISTSTLADGQYIELLGIDSSDNFFVGFGVNTNRKIIYIKKFDNSGTELFCIKFDLSALSLLTSVDIIDGAVTDDYLVLAVGCTKSDATKQIRVIKYPADGSITGTFNDLVISSSSYTSATSTQSLTNTTLTTGSASSGTLSDSTNTFSDYSFSENIDQIY